MHTPYLEMRGITKKFPGVLALNNVDFSVDRGQIVALVGENGAGKSTLIKVLAGIHRQDQGYILLDGKTVDINSPLEARNNGISVIYQELNVLSNLNIAENIFIGREKRRGIFVDQRVMHREAKDLLDLVGLNVSTHTLVEELTTAQRQMVEVAKALSVNSKIIVMDEPTSSLTEKEVDTLLGIIRRLKQQNVAIIFISHRMQEIFEIADAINIMRDGEMVGVLNRGEATENKVVQLMVGREIDSVYHREKGSIGEPILEVKDLSTKDFLQDVNFQLKKGEILGFTGLIGAGRSEVMRAIFGIDEMDAGEIFIEGEKAEINSPEDAIGYGIGFVPEDRKEQALILGMTIRENITLPFLKDLSRCGFVDSQKENAVTLEYIEALDIRTPDKEQKVINLSGGNQQKVVISKWLATEPKILILDEPTRGIDVGAKKEMYGLISSLARQGVSIIMVSSELPEVLGMSDRIIVMHEGRIKGELSREEASQERIMQTALS